MAKKPIKKKVKKCKSCGHQLYFGICINCKPGRLRLCPDCYDRKKRIKDRYIIFGRFHDIESCKYCGKSMKVYKCVRCGITFINNYCICAMLTHENTFEEVDKAWHQFASILNKLHKEGRLDEVFPENYKEWCEEIRAEVYKKKVELWKKSLNYASID
ncbi:MAG: hypothetical protein ACFFDB_00470 [Promethearchaeota archaeon]